MAATEASTSNETAPPSVDINALIGKGRKHLICNEVVEAVSCFADACYQAGLKYGEKADECAESYYLYGSALLELSRMENGVLGNALSGVKVREEEPEDEFTDVEGPKISEISEEEKEQVKSDVHEAMEAKEDEEVEGSSKKTETKEDKEESMEVAEDKGEEKKSEEKAEEKTETEGNKGEEQKSETKESDEKMEEVDAKEESEEKAEASKSNAEESEEKMEEGEKKEESEDKAEGKEDDEEDEALGEEVEDDDEAGEDGEEVEQSEESDDHKGDDVPTLQLSWEMLELAKFIYSKQEGPEARKKEAQALSKLGEISLEQEQYSQAIQDLQDCLKLVDGIYEPDSRALAEIHYNLGLAFNFDSLFEDAAINFKKSVEIIKLKLKSLEEQIEKAEEGTKGKEKANADDPCQAAKREVKELEALLPELTAKIEDAEEMKKSAPAMVAATKDAIKNTIGIPITDDTSSASPFDTGFGLEEKKSDTKTDSSPASDITHLVRRKRKPEDEKSEESPKEHVPAKKARPSLDEKPTEEINGNGEMKQNGEKVVPNGDSTAEPVTV